MGPAPRLTEAERKLWNAFPTGETVELGPFEIGTCRKAGANAPTDGDTWGPERSIRAEVIASLLLGAREVNGGSVPSVRLRGARITGRLVIAGGTIPHELILTGCHLDEPIRLTDSTTRTIRLTDCHLPGISGGGMHVAGHLSLSGSNITGAVRLARAQFESGLWLGGTRVATDDDDDWALYANAITVDAGTYLRNADFTGGINLVGARLNGGFFLEGAKLSNPGKDALDAENMAVEDTMRCTNGFQATGCLLLRGARINGTLSIAGTVRSPDTRYALYMSHMEIRELYLNPAEPIEGVVTLAYSTIGTLHDHPDVWPEKLRLNGLTYNRLRGGGVAKRIDWVTRDPDGFRPQPYEQLAAWYLSDGNDVLARRTQLAKLRARRQTQGVGTRVWGRLLDGAVGYGYRPWLAGMWFGLLLTLGTVVFALIPPRALKPTESPDFNSFAYTFDLLLPIPAFGQRELFAAVGWTQWLAYALIISGWILATALIAGATRILRPQ
ncbi:hypothetical protein SAMN05444920_10458 [Nonomuraea solani]|uniref:Membrane-associated oxidoreductase n=1 Tax=Nonomuraea solani TaxID=1144553 RepID=A0A1H6CJR3_9ACTN|nr:hypothetical protein [Nonomuraea solani]SEG73158.1 hypothetical protein SAMN05444920_10458 [Nonomuraea solani]